MKQSLIGTDNTIEQARVLKLPSSSKVTADNLWKIAQTIASTAMKFTQEQLKNADKTLPPKDTIVRILAYLKYLDYLTESREEERQGGKKIKVQYFVLNEENPLVKNIRYEIKGSRVDEAQKLWYQLIREHDLTRIIVEEFFANDTMKTRLDLEYFFKSRNELSDKTAIYYQNGVTFLIKLLGQAGVLLSKGNTINSQMAGIPIKQKDKQDEVSIDVPLEKFSEDIRVNSKAAYNVRITGPGVNASMDILEDLDIQIVEKYLEKIKKKLAAVSKTEHNNNEDSKSIS